MHFLGQGRGNLDVLMFFWRSPWRDRRPEAIGGLKVRILCLIGIHRPNRERIWDDGINMRAKCSGCGRGMIRDQKGWRLFRASDANLRRRPHPRSGG